ncbi:MAG: ABC transporter substrate-binding protein, partial [Desulfobacteraceae bacterium]
MRWPMGRWLLLAAAAVALFAVGGCAERRDVAAERELTLWAHAGREAERATLEVQLRRFEAANTGVRVRLTFIPEGAYNGQVQAAALAGRLPDLLEL